MSVRTEPANTKLVIGVWHSFFTEWNAKPVMADTLRQRWPQMKVVHVTNVERLPAELADADIFVGSVLRPAQFAAAQKIKVGTFHFRRRWATHVSGVAQLRSDSHQRQRHFFRPHGRTHHRLDIGLGAKFPRHCAPAGKSHLVAAGFMGQASASRGNERNFAPYRGLRIDRQGSSATRQALGMRVWGVTRSGKGDATHAKKIVSSSELHNVLPQADYVLLCAPRNVGNKLPDRRRSNWRK